MKNNTIKQQLKTNGIKVTYHQLKEIEMLINSGKTDLRTVKKVFSPPIPENLMNESIKVLSQIEINLREPYQ